MEGTLRQLSPAEFPPLLREIPDPPPKLYLRGTLPPAETKLLAVVGSRRNSAYGKDACETLLAGLAGAPVAIVSGLAIGIDAIAHRAALRAGLPTIAVPGSGLRDDILYPASHRELARKILAAGGALLSEFEPDFEAAPWAFPQRNRIMAGLSAAVLVVEAAPKSGTLITARLAADYNRDVLVVPGSIFSENAYGPHMLLRLGATPVRSSADILEALGFPAGEKTRKIEPESPEEARILELLADPLSRAELLERLAIPAREASITIASLELRGAIVERMGTLRRADASFDNGERLP